MWFPIVIFVAVMLSIFAPRLANGLAWGITLTVNVPLAMVSAGTLSWAFGLPFGLTGFSLVSWMLCCFIFGGPPALFIAWVTHKE